MMNTKKLVTDTKKQISSLLYDAFTTKLEKYPLKNQEVVISFPVYQNKRDVLIRNEGRNNYSLHVILD